MVRTHVVQDDTKWTAAHIAALEGYSDILATLIEAEANLTVRWDDTLCTMLLVPLHGGTAVPRFPLVAATPLAATFAAATNSVRHVTAAPASVRVHVHVVWRGAVRCGDVCS